MLMAAAAELPIDLSRSWIAGDNIHDVLAGRRAGLRGAIFVNPAIQIPKELLVLPKTFKLIRVDRLDKLPVVALS